MKNIVIIGAGGYGREIAFLAKEVAGHSSNYCVKGFLDDTHEVLNDYVGYPPILGAIESYMPAREDVFVCALGAVEQRMRCTKILQEKGAQFASLIHPTAIIRQNVCIGQGAVIHAYCTISCDVRIGDHVHIQGHSTIGHDVRMGDWCHISAQVFMGGFVSAESECQVYTRATILPKVKIGAGAVIGAGSVVLRNVKSGATVFGNPARDVHNFLMKDQATAMKKKSAKP